jgi:histidine triad (HIT) family protein
MNNDFYCDEVFSGKTPVDVVAETENVLAFHHTRPFFETHIVVVPKRHVASLLTLKESDRDLLIELFETIKKVALQLNVEKGAARVLTNIGDYQDSKHLHFHVYYGKQIRPDEY